MGNWAWAKRRRDAAVASAVVLTSIALLGACSKVPGSRSSGTGRPTGCTYLAKLDTIASAVAKANVADPTAFEEILQAAVNDYVANVRRLRGVAPAELTASLVRVEADVQQFRFDAALTDRAPLDAYAARTCGRAASTPTTVVALGAGIVSTTTSAPSGGTTLPANTSGSTVPSDG